jgi:response regulator of citrate/malate metabolism
MSGYTHAEIVSRGVRAGIGDYVAKPFTATSRFIVCVKRWRKQVVSTERRVEPSTRSKTGQWLHRIPRGLKSKKTP